MTPTPKDHSTKIDALAVRINDAANMLGLSRSSIYNLAQEGRLRIVKIAGRSLVRTEDLRKLLSEAA